MIVLVESAGATPSTTEIASLAAAATGDTTTKAASSRNRFISKSCLTCNILFNGDGILLMMLLRNMLRQMVLDKMKN